MPDTIHLIHGIHTSDPFKSIGKFYFLIQQTGFAAYLHNYGYITALMHRFTNPLNVPKITQWIRPNDIIIGHSNGCTLAHMVSKLQPVQGLVLINPALNDNIVFDKRIQFIHVYFNHSDGAVPWADLWVHDIWGDMGRDGYKGSDERVTQFDCCSDKQELPCVDGHSAFFKEPCWTPWSNFLLKNVLDATNVPRT